MNRGIARRSIFETRADVRRFLSLLTCAVRAGRIELHAFVFMLTHFHLLVRSLDGQLSETMRLVQNSYVRSFNRTRRRDGPLMRGRFRSIPVATSVYTFTLIRYIDQNPVEAHLVACPSDYPHGSARYHRLVRHPRTGLDSSLVDGFLRRHVPEGTPRGEGYDMLFRPRLRPEQRTWVEKRLNGAPRGEDQLGELMAGATAGVRTWARAKARLADDTKPGLPLVDSRTVERVVQEVHERSGDWVLRARGYHAKDGWEVLKAALLRDLAGDTYASVARRLERSPAYPRKLYQVHVVCLEADDVYADRFGALARTCLHRLHGTSKW